MPEAPRRPVTDVVHGCAITDPYRWLEDGTSVETLAFTDAQNNRSRRFLDSLPRRPEFRADLLALLDIATSAAPALAGDSVFSLDRPAGSEQAMLVARPANPPADSDGWMPRTILDPIAVLGDATSAIDWYEPSIDGRLVAVGLSTGGDERSILYVVDSHTGELTSDRIPETRAASIAWDPDNSGFAYTRYPSPGEVPEGEEEYHRTVWHHRLGTDPATDKPLFTDLPDPTAWPTIVGSEDGRWLLVHLSLGWARTHVILVDRNSGERRPVVAGIDAVSQFTFDGDRLLGTTSLGAPRGRVVAAPLDDPGTDRWTTLVAESETVIEAVERVGDGFVVIGSLVAVSTLTRHDRDGRIAAQIELPELATIGATSGDGSGRLVVSLASFARPGSVRGLVGERLVPWSAPPPADPSELVVEQVHYPSTDETLVPMFLVRHRDTLPDTTTPTLLTGYGGFAIAEGPRYSPLVVAWCRAGGQVAVANIRGGSEHGEQWHQAGMLDRKQQCFDDFFAAGDWLISTGRGSAATLAVRGGSNGGLLMGAVITQRPDLARAVHCAVPLLDMVRYHRFLIGRLWIPEYGDPDDPAAFGWLHAYSPYHRVVDGTCYPAMLITAAEGDSRVDPMHARKMTARLQHATACGDERPILLGIEREAGHGQGKPRTALADEAADTMAFLWHALAG